LDKSVLTRKTSFTLSGLIKTWLVSISCYSRYYSPSALVDITTEKLKHYLKEANPYGQINVDNF
jgi:hypothetical protein